MLKIRCTEVTFSPNKWEDVILRFDVLKEDAETFKEHIVRQEEIRMPFFTYTEVLDRKTGETKTMKHSCMSSGDFTATFRHAITAKAMGHFYPGVLDIFIRMTTIALRICGTHELAQLASPDEFLDAVKSLEALRSEAMLQRCNSKGKALLKTVYAWQLYRSIVEVFDAWTRELKEAPAFDEDEEDETDNENE